MMTLTRGIATRPADQYALPQRERGRKEEVSPVEDSVAHEVEVGISARQQLRGGHGDLAQASPDVLDERERNHAAEEEREGVPPGQLDLLGADRRRLGDRFREVFVGVDVDRESSPAVMSPSPDGDRNP